MVSLLQTVWFVVVRFIARSEITELNSESSLIAPDSLGNYRIKF